MEQSGTTGLYIKAAKLAKARTEIYYRLQKLKYL
jgi:hypothetical protein